MKDPDDAIRQFAVIGTNGVQRPAKAVIKGSTIEVDLSGETITIERPSEFK